MRGKGRGEPLRSEEDFFFYFFFLGGVPQFLEFENYVCQTFLQLFFGMVNF